MFASSIPEIIELVGSGSKYGGELKREHGKRYKASIPQFGSSKKLFQSILPLLILNTIKNNNKLLSYKSIEIT